MIANCLMCWIDGQPDYDLGYTISIIVLIKQYAAIRIGIDLQTAVK